MAKYSNVIQKKDDSSLVEVLENYDNYSEEFVKEVVEEIKIREISKEDIEEYASNFYREKVEEYFENFSVINDEFILPESHFLERENMVEIVKEVFNDLMERREDMSIDVWHYVIGALL